MEHAPIMLPDREDAMTLLKTMVFLCILCVAVTLYAEFDRMRKFEKLIQRISEAPRYTSDRKRSPLSGSCDGGERIDRDARTPTP